MRVLAPERHQEHPPAVRLGLAGLPSEVGERTAQRCTGLAIARERVIGLALGGGRARAERLDPAQEARGESMIRRRQAKPVASGVRPWQPPAAAAGLRSRGARGRRRGAGVTPPEGGHASPCGKASCSRAPAGRSSAASSRRRSPAACSSGRPAPSRPTTSAARAPPVICPDGCPATPACFCPGLAASAAAALPSVVASPATNSRTGVGGPTGSPLGPIGRASTWTPAARRGASATAGRAVGAAGARCRRTASGGSSTRSAPASGRMARRRPDPS